MIDKVKRKGNSYEGFRLLNSEIGNDRKKKKMNNLIKIEFSSP